MTPATGTGTLEIGGARLVYQTTGAGGAVPFVFQHGMGGDANQPLGYVGEAPPASVVALNARGHGPSSDIDPAAATFDTFADDVIALADHLGLDRFVVGGISLGAGTALNLAIRYPARVTALVLCRPAWLDRPQAESNRRAYAEIADLLENYPPQTAAAKYIETSTYQTTQSISPAAAASLLGQLTRPRAAENSGLLRAFPDSSPTGSRDAWRAIEVPTLVIAHHDDPFHPYDIGQAHADTIPSAILCTVPSKDADPAHFASEIKVALHDFLRQL